MDILFFVGQSVSLLALGYGAWVCFLCAGRYDAEQLEFDVRASRASIVRSHVERTAVIRQDSCEDVAA